MAENPDAERDWGQEKGTTEGEMAEMNLSKHPDLLLVSFSLSQVIISEDKLFVVKMVYKPLSQNTSWSWTSFLWTPFHIKY